MRAVMGSQVSVSSAVVITPATIRRRKGADAGERIDYQSWCTSPEPATFELRTVGLLVR
jgi:hypothetical protein